MGSAYARLGIAAPRGVLLHGPPGNSKTTLARALALAVGCGAQRFFALSGAELFSAYVGESERALRDVFARAREAAPSLLFLDEIDAMVGGRGIAGAGGDGGGGASGGILATLLTEMDGLAGGGGVLVVGATNRLGVIDPALLRPGRLELHVEVEAPRGAAAVEEVLRVHTRAMPLARDVDLALIARTLAAGAGSGAGAGAGAGAGGWSGAELQGLCAEAALVALREDVAAAASVRLRHWATALAALRPAAAADAEALLLLARAGAPADLAPAGGATEAVSDSRMIGEGAV
jgi:ATP-dependent 26S proteasome regulatory subunit